MIKLKVKELESRLGKKIERNCISFGVDTASRSGWCKIEVNRTNISIDCGTLSIKANDVYFKYDRINRKY